MVTVIYIIYTRDAREGGEREGRGPRYMARYGVIA